MKGLLRAAMTRVGVYHTYRRSTRAYQLWRVRRAASPLSRWQSGLGHEVAYWDEWLKTRGLTWPDEFARRLDPQRTLEDYVAHLLPAEQGPVRILDVGAGPLTCLGSRWPGGQLEITPVDPLADAYNALLARYHVEPLVPTVPVEAEELVAAFADATFDLAHARNALDHCYDPLRAIEQMVRVVKPGRYVVLMHYENEAENVGFRGLHQWGFTVRDGELLVRHPRSERNVSRHLAGMGAVSAWVEDGYVRAEIQRLPRKDIGAQNVGTW